MPDYLLEAVLTLVLPILTALGTLLSAYLVRLIRAQVAHVQTREALERLVHAGEVAVGEVAQTFVDDMKAQAGDGKLTKDEVLMAKERALMKLKQYAGPKGLQVARDILGHDDQALDRYLIGLIEAEVKRLKGQS